jgi:hypothetical protein
MAEKYKIDWSVSGTTEILASSAEAAEAAFAAMPITTVVTTGTLEVIGGPITEAEEQRQEAEHSAAFARLQQRRSKENKA